MHPMKPRQEILHMPTTHQVGSRCYELVPKSIGKETRIAINWHDVDSTVRGVLGGWYMTEADAITAIETFHTKSQP